jgi:hypothetical protein
MALVFRLSSSDLGDQNAQAAGFLQAAKKSNSVFCQRVLTWASANTEWK